MPPKRPVRRSLPITRIPRPKSETPPRDGSSSPDPLDVISNKASPESQRRQTVYISKSNSRDSGSHQSFSSSPASPINDRDPEDSSESDSQDSVKDQFRRQRAYSEGSEGESDSEEEEDEWATFLSSSARKQRRESARSSTGSGSRDSRQNTENTDNTTTPVTSPTFTKRPFELNPIRNRLERSMVDDQMDGSGIKVEDVVQPTVDPAGEEMSVGGSQVELEVPQTPEPALSSTADVPEVDEGQQLPPNEEESGFIAKLPEEVGLGNGDHASPPNHKFIDRHREIPDDRKIIAAAERLLNEAAVKQHEPTLDISKPAGAAPHAATDIDVEADSTKPTEAVSYGATDMDPKAGSTKPAEAVSQPTTDLGVEADSTTPAEAVSLPAGGIDDEADASNKKETGAKSPRVDNVEDIPPDKDVQLPENGQDMDSLDVGPDSEVDHPATTPAATSEAGIEEGEEELDEDVAPSPEADLETGNTDIEMDGSSAPPDTAPVAEVKIRKKPGPKPKPKQTGHKVEAAAKKAAKGTKGKKVEELKTTSKKNARFTPDTTHLRSVSVVSGQGDEEPEPVSDRIYCVCRKKESDDDEDVTMVGCESCDDWFHAACVGLTEDQVKNMDVYICRSCERSTKQKTIYKKTCQRDGCNKGLGLRVSKFCSDLCAYKHFKDITDAVTNKKTLKSYSASFGSFPRPVPVNIIHHGETRSITQTDDQTEQIISAVQQQLTATATALEIVRKRQQILQIAIDKSESLPPIIVQVEESRSKSKRKGGGGPTEDKQCAWDPRLIWDTEAVQTWVEAEGEEVEICGLGKRRCDKHSGWQKTSAIALEAEEMQLGQKQSTLSSQAAELAKAVEAAAESVKVKSEFKQRLAKSRTC